MNISLIIPAFNEKDYLPTLLDTVHAAALRYVHGPTAIQVILSDNGSTDGTAAIALEHGCLVVHESRRIIAAVRNAGAHMATGRILAFSDADNRIHPDTFNAIDQALSDPKVVGGATGVNTERMSMGIAAALAVFLPMVWFTGMDTGVVFCRTVDFKRIGGYNEARLFAEDAAFLWNLKQLGRRTGRRIVRLIRCKAVTSMRKFDRFGDWHYIGLILMVLFSMIMPGRMMAWIARTYWYGNQRSP